MAYAERMELPHKWTEAETGRGAALRRTLELEPADLPTVLSPDAVLVNATPSQLARHLALSPSRVATKTTDLMVIGGGPAGLAAIVYGASEGLQTTMRDAIAPGGQAAASQHRCGCRILLADDLDCAGERGLKQAASAIQRGKDEIGQLGVLGHQLPERFGAAAVDRCCLTGARGDEHALAGEQVDLTKEVTRPHLRDEQRRLAR